MAQLAIDKGVKCSRDGTLYCEILAKFQSQPKVWEVIKHTQKDLPPDVFESIQAMFTDEKREFGEGVDFLENILHNSTVFAETSSEVVSTNDQEGVKSPNVMTSTLMNSTSCII